MPVLSWGHSAYWAKDTGGAESPGAATGSGYAGCQANVFGGVCVGSLFGALDPWLAHLSAVMWWWVRYLSSQSWRFARTRPARIASWWALRCARAQWWWHWYRGLRRVSPEDLGWLAFDLDRLLTCAQDRDRGAALARVLIALTHESYPHAQRAVRETAVTLGFNRPEAWIPYSRMLKSDSRRAENLFRHVRACEAVKAYRPDVSNPDLNLITELAYHAFAARQH